MLAAKKGTRDLHQEDIIELLRKYDEEKELLVQENKNLQARIFKEIDENHKSRLAFQRREADNKRQIAELERQLSSRASDEQAVNDQIRQLQTVEKQYHEILQKHSQVLLVVKDNEKVMDSMKLLLDRKDQEYHQLGAHNKDLQLRLGSKEEEYQEISKEVSKLEQNLKQISEERERLESELMEQNQQLEHYENTLSRLDDKYKASKKERKALETEIAQLTIKQHALEEQQERQLVELMQVTTEKQKVSQQVMTLNTDISLQQTRIKNLEKDVVSLEADHQKTLDSQQQRQAELTMKCSALRSQNERYEKQMYEYHEEATRNQQQYRQAILSYELTFKSMKDKILMELIEQSRQGSTDEAVRRLESCMDSVRKSSQKDSKIVKLKERVQQLEDQLRTLKDNRLKTTGAKSSKNLVQIPQTAPPNEAINIEKIRLEGQLTYFQVQLSLAKKQLEQLRLENTIVGEKLNEAREQLNDKCSQLTTMQSDSAKLEKFYVEEIKKCINELQTYKERDIVSSEFVKEQKQFKEIFALKVANYEKKIKDLVEGVERKEGIIESLKIQKKQLEETLIKQQDKLTKLEEQADLARKAKSDCVRKEELMQQYKSRWEAKKTDFEQVLGQRDRLRRENDRLEKSLERKGHYLQTVKAKYEKELGDIEKKLKSNSSHTKSISTVMEHKLLEMKKECGQYEEALEQVATHLLRIIRLEKEGKMGAVVKTRKSKSKRKVNLSQEEANGLGSATKSTKGWEAAKILGLKENEIDEFLNPRPEPLPDREEELEELWRRGGIMEFFEKAIDYLRTILTS